MRTRMMYRRLRRFPRLLTAPALMFCLATPSLAQIPGLPVPAPSPPAGKTPAAAEKDNTKGAVATPAGPIKVREDVPNHALRRLLAELLPKYPGVRSVDIAVENGVVTLNGRVDDADTYNDVTNFASRVEGVRIVLNRMKTDDEVMTAPELVMRELRKVRDYLAQKWLLILLAAGILLVSGALARVVGQYSEVLMAPFVSNVLLRSIAGSLLSTVLVAGGLLAALSILNLSRIVLSILGFAGVVGLAVGFAFRDITENFIASVLLGVRRPFQIGDYIHVAGQAGVIKSLNTRATVLVTLDGDHVRIPNSTIFKEILINSTASPSSRVTFDVVIPYEASAAEALKAINDALSGLEGAAPNPPARALVEALEPGGVRIRAYLWTPTQGADGLLLASDAKLRVKVALQRAGILAPQPAAPPAPASPAVPEGHEPEKPAPRNGAAAHPVNDNLKRDIQAAAQAKGTCDPDRPTPIEHVLNEAESRVSEEGENLLANGHTSSRSG